MRLSIEQQQARLIDESPRVAKASSLISRRPNGIKIRCVELPGRTWKSMALAAEELHVPRTLVHLSVHKGYGCKGYHFYEKAPVVIRHRRNRVVKCLDTGESFPSIKHAALWLAGQLGSPVTPRFIKTLGHLVSRSCYEGWTTKGHDFRFVPVVYA